MDNCACSARVLGRGPKQHSGWERAGCQLEGLGESAHHTGRANTFGKDRQRASALALGRRSGSGGGAPREENGHFEGGDRGCHAVST